MVSLMSIFIVAAAIFIGTCAKLFWPSLKDDNVIEEIAEHVIQHKTEVNVDLTPNSPEDKK